MRLSLIAMVAAVLTGCATAPRPQMQRPTSLRISR
jgi:hypothetical protein